MSESEKVLMLVENASVPGDPRVWREAQTLAHNGYQVCIISPRGETRDTEPYTYLDGIHIYRYHLPTVSAGTWGYIQEYSIALLKTFALSWNVLFKHGFDVIHAANPPDLFFLIGAFYRLFGKKFIFDQHDLAPEIFNVKFQRRKTRLYKLLCLLERCSYKTAHLVITTNGSQKQNAMLRGKCTPEKIFVVRNGPDLARYQVTTQVDCTLKAQFKQRFLLAYIGVMGRQDGIEYAIQALDELVHKRQRNDIGLVLMGDGEQLVALKALTAQLGLEEYVYFTGWLQRTEMLRYLSICDIGLTPDPSNELNDHSTMLKTMEYMALSKPVVAFDLPETRVSAEDAALYATHNSIHEFADHIETLLADETLRRTMGQKGRQRVEETLCWERTSLNLLQAYRRLFPHHRASTRDIPTIITDDNGSIVL